MQINVRELNGIFQIDYHTSTIRFLWMTFVSISLSIIAFGVWTAKTDLFNFSQDVASKYFEIALAIFSLLVVPAVVLIIGLIKIIKKPGITFTGVRVAIKGLEIGTLTIDGNSVSPKIIWENNCIANDVFGEWKQKKIFNDMAINILIVLRKRHKQSKHLFLERVVFSSRNERLFKMFGYNSLGARWNDLVAISQGSFSLIGNDDGIYPVELSSFRKQTTDIVSSWKPSFGLSCTLKTIPSLENLENVFAFGVLGGIATTGAKSNDKESIENIYDNFVNEKKSSVNFDQNG